MIAIGAVCAVMLRYDALPETIPVTRWTSAAKSPLVALRIPLINLLMLGLVEVLLSSLRRTLPIRRAHAVASVLLLTAAAKACIEGVAIVALPTPLDWTVLPLIAVIAAGLGTAVFLCRELLENSRWRHLTMTKRETTLTLVLVAGIAILNVPLLC